LDTVNYCTYHFPFNHYVHIFRIFFTPIIYFYACALGGLPAATSTTAGVTLTDFSEFESVKVLASSSTSEVRKAKWRSCFVVLKLLRKVGEHDESMRRPLLRELNVLRGFRHPRILLLLTVCNNVPGAFLELGLVTEWMERGSLEDIFKNDREESEGGNLIRQECIATLERQLAVAVDVVAGMAYLHQHNAVHRDLKSGNVLLGDDGRAKVGDFGLTTVKAASAASSSTTSRGGVGTYRWMAPEVGVGGRSTAASDVYSFGVILWELVTGKKPWPYLNMYQTVAMVNSGGRLEIPSGELRERWIAL